MTDQQLHAAIKAHIEQLKHDYAQLWSRYRQVVHENTQLSNQLDAIRRKAAMEGDEWMNL